MIENELQYQITKDQCAKFEKAIKDFNLEKEKEEIGPLAIAELDALKSESQILHEQIREYDRNIFNENRMILYKEFNVPANYQIDFTEWLVRQVVELRKRLKKLE